MALLRLVDDLHPLRLPLVHGVLDSKPGADVGLAARLRHLSLGQEQAPPESSVGMDPQEALVEGDEGDDVHQTIRVQVMQLGIVDKEQPPQEVVDREGEPALYHVQMHHPLTFPG